MKYQILFLEKIRKHVTNLSSAKFAKRAVKVKCELVSLQKLTLAKYSVHKT